jgi:hypothetical protein
MIRFRPLLGPALWFLPDVTPLIGLGVWQVERPREREALIASVEAGMSAALALSCVYLLYHRSRGRLGIG